MPLYKQAVSSVTLHDDPYGMSAQRNGCEPFAQPFLDEGLRAAANKLTDCNARKTKEIPKKIRDLFNLLGLPPVLAIFREGGP